MAAPWRDRDRAPPPPALHLARALTGPYVYAHVDADRLTTSGDAEERRRTRGPWTDGMVFGAAGHTAAGPRRKGGRGRVICCFDTLIWVVRFEFVF